MLAVGILSGVVLNLINSGRNLAHLPWDDPVIVSTLAMFAWLLLSTLIGCFYRPAREGRKVAYLTLVSFVFLVIALSTGLFLNTRHPGAKPDRSRQPAAKCSVSPLARGGAR